VLLSRLARACAPLQEAMVDNNAAIPGGAATSYIFAVWNLVIRPPRAKYDLSQLGPAEFEINGVRAHRRDVKLRTSRGAHLVCSHFMPRQMKAATGEKAWQKLPVVIYLHGNSSNRLEAGGLVAKLMERRISLFCFDWAGCGLSEGEYISLGWYERDDLATVIDHLRKSPFCGPIGIWGRSMGAVTALLHAHRDPTLGAMCLDSPFSSLRDLIEEIAASDRLLVPVPSWLVNSIIAVIRNRVQAIANFDIEELVPLSHAKRSYVPTLFMHGRGDSFVLPHHSEKLYEAWGGDKELMFLNGDHNTERSAENVEHGLNFMTRAFRMHEVDLSVPPHVVDQQLNVPEKDGIPHRIPHLPRPSAAKGRKALMDITNVKPDALNDQETGQPLSARRSPPTKFGATDSSRRRLTPPASTRQPKLDTSTASPHDQEYAHGKENAPPMDLQGEDQESKETRWVANRAYPTMSLQRHPGTQYLARRHSDPDLISPVKARLCSEEFQSPSKQIPRRPSYSALAARGGA